VTAEEWGRLMLAMGLLAVLFAFPVITIWRDERRKRRERADDPVDDATRR
jgi:hypothetical protein